MNALLPCTACDGASEIQTGWDAQCNAPVTGPCPACSGSGETTRDVTPVELVTVLVAEVRCGNYLPEHALTVLADQGLTAAPGTLGDAVDAAERRDMLADRVVDPWSLIDDDEVSWWRQRGVDALRQELADRADDEYDHAVKQLAQPALAPLAVAS